MVLSDSHQKDHGHGKVTICPTCNRPLPDIRLGIELTPLKARMFDLIKSSGDNGCTVQRMNDKIWDGNSNRSNIKSHIFQLNEMLSDTEYVITQTTPRYGFRLKHRTENEK